MADAVSHTSTPIISLGNNIHVGVPSSNQHPCVLELLYSNNLIPLLYFYRKAKRSHFLEVLYMNSKLDNTILISISTKNSLSSKLVYTTAQWDMFS